MFRGFTQILQRHFCMRRVLKTRYRMVTLGCASAPLFIYTLWHGPEAGCEP